MRTSNYLFTKGSIVFVKFPSTSDKAFLNGRPLIVVSNPSHILKTLVVCTTGTQNKPGIKVSFFNHIDKCYVGDTEISHIYPYSLMTIYTDQIIASIGQLDPFIMNEVDNAISFHLGHTTDIPKYLGDCEDDIKGVHYNNMSKFDLKHEVISKDFTPAVDYKRQYHKPESVCPSKSTKKNAKDAYKHIPVEIKSKGIKEQNSHNVYRYTHEYLDKWAKINPKDVDYNRICRNSSMLMKYVDKESINIICSRVIPLTMVMAKYNISKRNASFMRISLTNALIKRGIDILKTNSNISTSGKLSESYILGIILAKEFSNVICNNNIIEVYDDKIKEVFEKYDINFNDKRIWKSTENFYIE